MNGLKTWAPVFLSVIVVIAGLGVGWGKLSSAADQVKDNEEAIELLKKDLTTIKIGNAVINERLRNESKKAEEFREETQEDLSKILKELQNDN